MLQIIHLCCLQTSWLYLSKRKNCVFCGISWHVMRCWPLPPPKKKKKMVTPLPSPKNFQPSPPPVLKLFTPLLQLEMAASAFLHMAASNKHIFTFLKLLQLSKCCHSFFLKKLKQYIKETRFYHHTFQFFMCDDLSFVNTTQKTF